MLSYTVLGAGAAPGRKFPEPGPPQNRPAPKPWSRSCRLFSVENNCQENFSFVLFDVHTVFELI